MKNEFVIAITQLSAEKNLDSDTVFSVVEAAMASALKKDDLQYADLVVKINRASGDIETYRRYVVMDDDEIEDDEIQASPERAARMGFPGKQPGDDILEHLEASPNQGRIAAQTAKQVVLQRLREAERESVFEDFTGKEGELVSGTILRVEGGRRQVILDLGRTEAVLPAAEQIRAEHYRVGQRLRVYVKEVYKAAKGPQVVVSRSNPALLRRLFELEIPEIARGVVEIMGISRDAGYRAKVAVVSRQHGIDPIGACVGVRGARIQNIINELGGERIDIIRWDPVEEAFVANALSPAEVVSIRLERESNTAFIAVPDKQLTLAIGKEGQNARLAAQLTGRRIDIRAESALIQAGEDMYPPPEPNMEAHPIEQPSAAVAAGLAAPEQVAPSQAAYAQPGLPGERVRPTPAAPVPEEETEEEVRLTPEQEVLAEIIEAEDEIEEPAAEVEVDRPSRVDRPAAAGGLRFAEEIREVQRLEEDDNETRGRDRRRRGGNAAPTAPARAARTARGGTGRRFDLDEIDDEEIEAALHGDDFLDDEDEDEDDE
ncbi:MAG: transcription termination factor NusA [Chloroflexi bacterium]|nr:transcription termination factor NusA [Chloroflexota bacterium]